jgi:hypothetical protein
MLCVSVDGPDPTGPGVCIGCVTAGPALLNLLLATLSSDFFVLPPTFEFRRADETPSWRLLVGSNNDDPQEIAA